jgi:hypothetical protein
VLVDPPGVIAFFIDLDLLQRAELLLSEHKVTLHHLRN